MSERVLETKNLTKRYGDFTALDDLLQEAGAKFDIVDTITMDDLEKMSLTDVLLNAVID